MEKKIVLAGGTGFIGNYLSDYYKRKGYNVKIISRQSHAISWQDQQGIIDALED
jgi:NAD dependent epimerase/dehydratase family enzyme